MTLHLKSGCLAAGVDDVVSEKGQGLVFNGGVEMKSVWAADGREGGEQRHVALLLLLLKKLHLLFESSVAGFKLAHARALAAQLFLSVNHARFPVLRLFRLGFASCCSSIKLGLQIS